MQNGCVWLAEVRELKVLRFTWCRARGSSPLLKDSTDEVEHLLSLIRNVRIPALERVPEII